MKKLFLIAAALFTAISFNACTNDDHENSSDYTGIVSQIIQQNEHGTTEIYKFYYDDQGRVIRILNYDDCAICYSYSYTYTAGQVEITGQVETNGITDNFSYLATLNKQRYIATLNYPDDYDEYVDNFSYDKDGYLSKLWWDNEAYWLQCTWNNGDLISEHHTKGYYKGTYEYTNYPRKQNIDIFAITCGYDFYNDNYFIDAAGLVGRRSAHLIKSVNTDECDISFSYEFDSNGNPTKITKITTDKMTSKHKTRTYRIFYE